MTERERKIHAYQQQMMSYEWNKHKLCEALGFDFEDIRNIVPNVVVVFPKSFVTIQIDIEKRLTELKIAFKDVPVLLPDNFYIPGEARTYDIFNITGFQENVEYVKELPKSEDGEIYKLTAMVSNKNSN